jgi:hypothetical protein
MKVLPMAEKGFSATIEAFAASSMARRGIEPSCSGAAQPAASWTSSMTNSPPGRRFRVLNIVDE